MGARPSQFKKGGGGFLKGVDGVITGYEFTDAFNGVEFKAGKVNGKERFHSLYCLLSARVDGADEDVTTTLFVGGADDFNIEDDGHTLTPVEEGRELGANTSFAKLISTLVEAGFPETNLPEDAINFESIIGTRVRFEQRTDVEGTKKLGKRKDKKTGKEYDRQDLVIDQVYSLPGTAVTPAAKAPAAKPAAAKATKAPKAAAAPAGTDVSALAIETATTILAEAGGSISKAKLGMKVISKLMKHPEREAVRKFLFDDANLAAIDGVDYDAATTTVSIAA
jgi:hypothetical protein